MKLTQDQIAARLAGTPTRFTPAQCFEWRETGEMEVRYDGAVPTPKKEWRGIPISECGHTERHMASPGVSGNGGGAYFGLRRNTETGAFEYSKPAKLPANGRAIPKTTLENIAACAAFGLSYWSDAPGANNVWAVDEWQQAHQLHIDRKTGKVEGDYDGRDAYGYRVRWRVEAFEVPTTQQLLFGDAA